MPKLIIDDQTIEVEDGTTVLQAAQQLKIEIPEKRRAPNGKRIKVVGARAHNLKDVTVELSLSLLD